MQGINKFCKAKIERVEWERMQKKKECKWKFEQKWQKSKAKVVKVVERKFFESCVWSERTNKDIQIWICCLSKICMCLLVTTKKCKICCLKRQKVCICICLYFFASNSGGWRKVELFRSLSREGVAMRYSSLVGTSASGHWQSVGD